MEQNPIGADVEYSKMNAELKQATDAGFWTQWPGLTVNGTYSLRRLLGSSHRGAVFLTEHKAKNLPDAAIKFVRVDGRQADPLLEQWAGAATLDHPNLVRLFETGRYRFADQEFVFVVMEYADQTLAEILHRRALHPDELLEMLAPTLEALTFLHRRHLVHLQLKPSNVLAVGDQLKLASDTIRPLGQRAVGVTLAYDPPELKDHGITTAGDVWSLGATLVEALTQRTPSGSDLRFEQDLPLSLPAPLRDTVRRCLSLRHTDRPSVIELRSEYKSGTAPVAEVRPQAQSQPQPSHSQSPVAAQLQSPIQPPPSQVPPAFQAQPQPPIQPAPSPAQPALQSQPQPSLQVQLRARVEPQPAEPRPPIQPQPPQPQPSLQVRLRPRVPTQPAQPQAQAQPQSSQAQPQLQSQPRPQVETQPVQSQPQVQTQPRPQIRTPPAQPQAEVQPQSLQAQPHLQSQPRPQAQMQPAQAQPQLQTQPQPQIQTPPVQPQAQASLQSQPRPQVVAPPAQQQPQVPPQPPQAQAQPQLQNQPQAQIQPQPSQPQPEIQAQAPQAPRAVETPPQLQRPPRLKAPVEEPADSLLETAPTGTSAKRTLLLVVIAAALAISIWAWLDFRALETAPRAPQPPVASIPIPAPEPATDGIEASSQAATPAEQPPQAEPANGVLQEIIPTVPNSIQNKIQGRIYVTVRVLVDPAGDVVGVLMERPGPSKYFARLADNAARDWKFAPTEEDGDRVWRLNYLFTRDDVTVHATAQ